LTGNDSISYFENTWLVGTTIFTYGTCMTAAHSEPTTT